MKNIQEFKSFAQVMLITGVLTFSLSFKVEAQDSTKTASKKSVVVLKIQKDDNGKTTVIDTTFTITTPDVPPPPFPGYEGFEGEFMPNHDMRVLRYDNKRQTLSDIIGDIPMDRVKSYSIKDRKNGKRIIIDIEDAPLLENQDRVIIIRNQGKPPRNNDHQYRQMKVIINSDDDKQIEK